MVGALVRRVFTISVDDDLGDVVNHLIVLLHLVLRDGVHVGLNYKLVAIFAPLFPFGQQVEGSRIELCHVPGLRVNVPKALTKVGHFVQVQFLA